VLFSFLDKGNFNQNKKAHVVKHYAFIYQSY